MIPSPRRIFFAILTAFSVLISAGLSYSRASDTVYVIDSPTTETLDYGGYGVAFRLFNGGGLLTRLTFGVFSVVNLGFGWELNNLIGTGEVTAARPSLYLKMKLYSGGMVLPALSFGFDGQGYSYSRTDNEFTQRERGIFFVFGREMLAPGLRFNGGVNMYDFQSNELYGFINMTYNIEEKLILLAEYDNIHTVDSCRLNAGLQFYIVKNLAASIAARDLLTMDSSVERVLNIMYVGRF